MSEKLTTPARKRRSQAEIAQLTEEFVNSGMRRSEFCQSRGLSFSVLHRHLQQRRWKRKTRSNPSDGQLVPVEVATSSAKVEQGASCGLAVMLSGGRRIEVARDFDAHTLERLIRTLERV